MALGYKQLAEVEAAFKMLKHTLELRPLYHGKEERIRSHVLLCWLALLLIRVIETRTEASWVLIHDELERLHVVDFRAKDGTFRVTTEPTSEQRNLFQRLKIHPPKKLQKLELAPAQP